VCLNTPLFACQDCRTRPYVCIHTQIYISFKKYKYKYMYEFRGTTLRLPRLSTLILPRLSTLILMHVCTYRYNLYVYTFAYIAYSPMVVYTNPHINEYLFKNAIWLEAQRDALQHTATQCNTLQHTTTHCNTLQHTATHCNTLQHTATHYLAARQKIEGGLVRGWRHILTRCNTLQHTATRCNTPWRRVKRL